MSAKPLSHLKVLDLGTFIAAPFCATILAEFGAEVVKIEMPGKGRLAPHARRRKRGDPALLAAGIPQQMYGDLQSTRA
jgi:crotonobetainyl-CoA:carnitine CoA-transferase CaiB-like acyl-CoA transferase